MISADFEKMQRTLDDVAASTKAAAEAIASRAELTANYRELERHSLNRPRGIRTPLMWPPRIA
jgi:hypothetical protein